MKKIFSVKKMNNRGSALFLVMAAILFVMLMVSTVLAVAYSNIVLKRVGKSANQAFYTAETAVDEVYSGLGDQALQSVSDAYVYQLGEIVQDDNSIVNNVQANKDMKKYFVESYLKAITSDSQALTATGTYLANSTVNTASLIEIKDTMNGFLNSSGITGLSVKSVGEFTATAIDPDYILEIKDVVINYQSDKEYFSDITTDFMIKYPALNVSFNTDVPKDYLEYCLIAEDNLAFGNFNTSNSGSSNATTVTAYANAGLYAGMNLNVNNGSSLTIANGAKAVAHAKTAGERGIGIISGVSGSALKVGNATVWSGGDIDLGKVKTSTEGSELTATADSILYVEDDLEFNADKSSAEVKGEYYGYGNGYNTITGISNADEDNASIIMNGRFCSLNMNVSRLDLLGHAYIQTDLIKDKNNDITTSGYENGESVNIKNIQSIYMVQDAFLKSGATNPVSMGSPLVTADANNNYNDLIDYNTLKTQFFAYELLDATTPVIIAKDTTKNLYYLYYNFKTSENLEKYTKAIQTGTLNGHSVEANASYQEEKNVMARGIKKQFYDYASSSYIGEIKITIENIKNEEPNRNPGILGSYPSIMYANAKSGAVVDWVDGNMTDQEAKKRNGEIITNLNTIYGMMSDKTVYGTIVYASRVLATGSAGYKDEFTLETGEKYDLIVINSSEEFEVKSSQGIIIHNGGTLTVTKDFKGLIISNGTIAVKGNATLTTDASAVDYILSNEADFQKFFRYYSPDISNEFSIEKMAYEDIIYIQNWRKFED